MLTTVQLKEKLIATINTIDDSELLDSISRLIDLEKTEDIYQLSPGETIAVNEGIDQINAGFFLSNEESNKQADKWLRKYDGR